jgi:hypothetical protein
MKKKKRFEALPFLLSFVPSGVQRGFLFVFVLKKWGFSSQGVYTWIRVNDPSAGSPTETLLRLLLPLNDQV